MTVVMSAQYLYNMLYVTDAAGVDATVVAAITAAAAAGGGSSSSDSSSDSDSDSR